MRRSYNACPDLVNRIGALPRVVIVDRELHQTAALQSGQSPAGRPLVNSHDLRCPPGGEHTLVAQHVHQSPLAEADAELVLIEA